MASKRLTFKAPSRMKTVLLVFTVAFILSPGIRTMTASVLHTTANIIQPDSQ